MVRQCLSKCGLKVKPQNFKSFTATELMDAISKNIQESRKEWLQEQFKYFGSNSPQKQINQLMLINHNLSKIQMYLQLLNKNMNLDFSAS